MRCFETYLKDLHAKNYMGTDDEMADNFENRLSGYDAQDFMNFADEYVHTLLSTLHAEIITEISQMRGVYSATDALVNSTEIVNRLFEKI